MTSLDEDRLRTLIDRQAIEELMSRYAHAVDRHDADLISDIYHADAMDWHGPFRGDRDAFVAWVNPLHEGKTRARTHNITTHWSEVEGDVAFAESYVLFGLFLRDREVVMLGSGRYIDRVERRDGRWRIGQRTTLTEMRLEGDARGFYSAPGGYAAGQWDRSDLTYQRPLEITGADVASPVGRQSRAWDPATWQMLLDRRSVRDCITQSLRALDRGDCSLLLAQYRPGAKIVSGIETSPADAWIDAQLDAHSHNDSVVTHHLTTHLAHVSGDSARAESYVIVMRGAKDGTGLWTGGLRMLDELARSGDGWRIVSRRFIADWEFDRTNILAERDDGYPHGRRDPQDAWYQRG